MIKTVSELVKIKLFGLVKSTLDFMRGKNKSSKGMTVGTAIIIAIVLIAFLAMMVFTFGIFTVLGFQMAMKKCKWLFFVLAAAASFVFSLMGSIFAAKSYLFDSKDNELLLSMPISPSAILLSRMFTLFILNVLYSSLILIPVGISYGLIFHFSFITFILYIVTLLIIPALATAVSCIFGYLFSLVSDRIPNKNVMVMVFGMIMIAGLLLLGLNLGQIISDLLTNIEYIADNFRRGFPPLYWYGTAASGGNALYYLPMFFICVIPVIAAFLFLSKKFIKAATRKTSVKKKKYIPKEMKKTDIRLSLLKKEIGYFFSIPGYVMNCGMSTVMALFMAFGILLEKDNLVLITSAAFPEAASCFLPLVIGSALSMCCVINDITAPSISLEAKTLWILKSTPIKTIDVFVAKALLAPIISLPGILVTAVISAVCLPLSFLDILFIIVSPLAASIFSGFLGLCINLKLPRFDWAAEITVIKQSMSVIVTLLTAMFVTTIPYVLAILPAAYKDDWASVWPYSICVLYFLALAALEFFYLNTSGKKIFDKL